MTDLDQKPRLRFKGFTEAWEQRKLGDIFEFERPDKYMIKDDHYEETGIPVLTANKAFILGYKNETGAYSKGDCIIFDDFTLDSKYVDFPYKINSSVIKILTLKDNSNLKFDYYLLNQAKILQQGHARHYISVVQPTIVNVPKKCESNKIEKLFTNLDSLITLHQRKYEKLKSMKTALLEKMFPAGNDTSPKIRFKGFTEAWEQRKLGDTVAITMGQSPDGSTYSDSPSDYILVQGNADLKDGWVFPRIWTTQKTKTAEAGDLIMSVRAPAGAMGKTAYNAVIGRGVASIKGNEFVYQQLLKMDAEGFWKKDSSGSTFESLNSESIKNALVVVPSSNEQRSIGNLFLKLDAIITLHQRKCEKLKNLKKSLLERMFI